MWTNDAGDTQAVLIDPAAHGGHREEAGHNSGRGSGIARGHGHCCIYGSAEQRAAHLAVSWRSPSNVLTSMVCPSTAQLIGTWIQQCRLSPAAPQKKGFFSKLKDALG